MCLCYGFEVVFHTGSHSREQRTSVFELICNYWEPMCVISVRVNGEDMKDL